MSFTGLSAPVDIGQPVTFPVSAVILAAGTAAPTSAAALAALIAAGTATLTNPSAVYFSWDCIDPTTGQELVPETVWQFGTTGSITNPSPGIFQAVVTPTLGGLWRVRFVGTGACAFAQNGTFTCNYSPLTPP